jgi:hypothetical protein
MDDDTLTTENLLYILIAMKRIKPINQSLYYTQYMNEIIERLKENEILSKLRNQAKEPGNQ